MNIKIWQNIKKINNRGLMINSENGKIIPTYFTIKDRNILWFIQLINKVDKYQKNIDKKVFEIW